MKISSGAEPFTKLSVMATPGVPRTFTAKTPAVSTGYPSQYYDVNFLNQAVRIM